MAATHKVTIRRIYDSPSAAQGDGHRVLVDRLWPRGVAKEDLEFDEWPKDLTPSTDLRKWYGHELGRWERFVERYRAELSQDPARSELERLQKVLESHPVTLLTAVKQVDRSAAVVIAAALEEGRSKGRA